MAKAAAKATAKATEEDAEPADGEAAPDDGKKTKGRKLNPKKLALFIGLPVLLLGGAYQFGVLDMLLGGGDEATAESKEEEVPKEAVYLELPDMLVNLRPTGKQPSYLKLSVSLELDDPLILPEVEKVKPRIIDRFQVYLRELRAEDISGSAGVYRLKEELLARINAAIEPHEVKDVLFREMLIQ